MARGCKSGCGNGIGFAPYLFVDDAIEEQTFNGLNPKYAVLPVAPPARGNPTAALVDAAIGAAALTGNSSTLKSPRTQDTTVKVAANATHGIGYPSHLFIDDAIEADVPASAPYVPPTQVAPPAVLAPSNKLVKYGAIGVGAYLAWKLIGG